jgi:hypothetical protein
MIGSLNPLNASYEKPNLPTGLNSNVINSANKVLDSIYLSKSKYSATTDYLKYVDTVKSRLNLMKNKYISSSSKYILISYLID